MLKLGVNIDHVATLRQARGGREPDPVRAAIVCEEAGCDSIVCHLREDRRHIKEEDVLKLRSVVRTRLNLEMSVAADIVAFACSMRPDQATLVPERRQELTTEGGLDVVRGRARIKRVVGMLRAQGIEVSLFINPVKAQVDASVAVGAEIIELHTGEYANAKTKDARRRELRRLRDAAAYALSAGFEVNAGHGLTCENVRDIARIRGLHELNIGHSIIARAVFIGIGPAIQEMMRAMR